MQIAVTYIVYLVWTEPLNEQVILIRYLVKNPDYLW